MWDDCEGIGRLRDGREVLRTKEGTRHAQERKTIVRRVKAGLAARKAKGGRLGRVPLGDEHPEQGSTAQREWVELRGDWKGTEDQQRQRV